MSNFSYLHRIKQENTNKAVIADFFSESQDSCTTAFAATAFFNGYAGALAYFIFIKLPRQGTLQHSAVHYSTVRNSIVQNDVD